MKTKLFFTSLAFLLIGSVSLSAQFSAGAGLAYGTDVEELGIRAVGVYQFAEEWRGAADFIYYFDGVEDVSLWELNTNAHYVFSNDDKFLAYALAGLNLIAVTVDLGVIGGGKETNTEAGLNIGAGGQYFVTENVSIHGEVKYAISDADQIVIGIGALINIGEK